MTVARSTHARRGLLSPALALALAATALLVCTWPVVSDPPLRLLPAFLAVLGAWAAVVATLAWLAGRPTAEDAGPGEDDG